MPYKCSVKGCRSNYDSTKEKVSMFQFPSDVNLRKKWLETVELNSHLTNSSRICIKHFNPSEIDQTTPRRITLKPSAVPMSIEQQEVIVEVVEDVEFEVPEEPVDKIETFENFCEGVEDMRENISLNWNISIFDAGICFYRLSQPDEDFSDLTMAFKVIVRKDLHLRVFKEDVEASKQELDWVLKGHELVTWTQFEDIMSYYQDEPEISSNQNEKQLLKKSYQLLDLILKEEIREKVEILKEELANLYEEVELMVDAELDSQIDFTTPETSGIYEYSGKNDAEYSYIEETVDDQQIMETEDLIEFEPKFGGSVSYCCDICGELFQKTNLLQLHMKTHKAGMKMGKTGEVDSASPKGHSKKKLHECEICSKAFSTTSLRNEHMKTHSKNMDLQQHLEIIDGSPRYVCPKCNKNYESGHFLQKHIASNCRQPLKKRLYRYPCSDCAKTFTTKNLAVKHLQSMHKITIQNVDKYCFVCHDEFEDYTNHAREHSCRYSCSFCGAKFLTQDKVTKHEEAKHANETLNDRPYKCKFDDCGLSFKNVNHLKSHLTAIHTLTKREFQCNVCDKRFAFRALLTAHSRSHIKNLVLFPCNEPSCDRRFKKLNNLKQHSIRDHGIDAIYLCGFDGCCQRFQMLNDLKKHRDKIHGDSFNIHRYFDNARK